MFIILDRVLTQNLRGQVLRVSNRKCHICSIFCHVIQAILRKLYFPLFIKKNIFLRQISVCDSSLIQISKSFDFLKPLIYYVDKILHIVNISTTFLYHLKVFVNASP